jgi:hypothetical protein
MARPEITDRKLGLDPVTEPSYTTLEFCQAERISVSVFYKLKRLGLAPDTICYPGGRLVRITHAARLAWQAKMRELQADQGLQIERERNAAAARRAGTVAAASDRHLSKNIVTRRKIARARRARSGGSR